MPPKTKPKKPEKVSIIKLKKQDKPSFLAIKEVIPDIKQLPKWFKWMLIIGSILIVLFNFFNIEGNANDPQSFFVPLNEYNGVLATDAAGNFINYSTFGHTTSAAMAVAVLYSLNGLASFTGLLLVAMIVYARPSQYFWGLVNAVFYGLFALSVGYIGDFFMNLIKFVTTIPAWWLIVTIFKNNKLPDRGKWFTLSFWIGVFFIIGFLMMMWLFFIPEAAKWIFGNNAYMEPAADGTTLMWGPQHILDSFSQANETVAYTFQMLNLGEQLYVWAIVNFTKLLKFTNIAPGTLSINMLIQFGLFNIFNLVGLYQRNLKPLMVKWGWIKEPVEKEKVQAI